jgi:hypothetical protein
MSCKKVNTYSKDRLNLFSTLHLPGHWYRPAHLRSLNSPGHLPGHRCRMTQLWPKAMSLKPITDEGFLSQQHEKKLTLPSQGTGCDSPHRWATFVSCDWNRPHRRQHLSQATEIICRCDENLGMCCMQHPHVLSKKSFSRTCHVPHMHDMWKCCALHKWMFHSFRDVTWPGLCQHHQQCTSHLINTNISSRLSKLEDIRFPISP